MAGSRSHGRWSVSWYGEGHGTRRGHFALLANIYLNYMDTIWEEQFSHLGKLIRYADDFVIMCTTKAKAMEGIRVLNAILNKLYLTINRDKSRLVIFGPVQTVLISWVFTIANSLCLIKAETRYMSYVIFRVRNLRRKWENR